jgi:hypothetical protein
VSSRFLLVSFILHFWAPDCNCIGSGRYNIRKIPLFLSSGQLRIIEELFSMTLHWGHATPQNWVVMARLANHTWYSGKWSPRYSQLQQLMSSVASNMSYKLYETRIVISNSHGKHYYIFTRQRNEWTECPQPSIHDFSDVYARPIKCKNAEYGYSPFRSMDGSVRDHSGQ